MIKNNYIHRLSYFYFDIYIILNEIFKCLKAMKSKNPIAKLTRSWMRSIPIAKYKKENDSSLTMQLSKSTTILHLYFFLFNVEYVFEREEEII